MTGISLYVLKRKIRENTKGGLSREYRRIGTGWYQYNRKKTSIKRGQRVDEWIESRQTHQSTSKLLVVNFYVQ